MLLLSLTACIAVPPTGRWEGELAGGAPSGHLGNPGHHVPLLGNGYIGLQLQSSLGGSPSTRGVEFNGSTLDLFVNTNANWDCERAKTTLPPAVCSMRALGGLTINVANSTSAGRELAANGTCFTAEQRMYQGSLWTQRSGLDGSILRTETVIHDNENAILTTVSFQSSATAAVVELELALWTLGRSSHVRSSAASACMQSDSGLASCYRRFNDPNVTFFAPWTALGNRVVDATPIRTAVNDSCPNRFACLSTATAIYRMYPGTTLQIVTTVADNLLTGSAHDPSTDAAALAHDMQPDTIAAASSAFWAQYWNASSVSLPSRVSLERMWFGALYVTATATASASVVDRWQGKLPPPGVRSTVADLLAHCCFTLYNHTLTHSHTLLITCTCCYDQIKGTQDKDFSYSFSESHSLLLWLCNLPHLPTRSWQLT